MAVNFRSVFGIYNLHRLNGEKQESRELWYGLTILYKALPSNRHLYVRLFIIFGAVVKYWIATYVTAILGGVFSSPFSRRLFLEEC
jgi:hypothetical protein